MAAPISTLVLFSVEFGPAAPEAQRKLHIFIDGVYHDTRPLPPGTQRLAGLYAPRGALVRLLLATDLAQGCAEFVAGDEAGSVRAADMTISFQGDLFGPRVAA